MGTSMKVSRSYSSGSNSASVDRLLEKEMTLEVGSQVTVYLPITLPYASFEIRTVLVTNENNLNYVLSMYDRKEDGDLLYRSLQESATYDIVNVPGKDKDGTDTLHVYLENKGTTASKFRVVIKLTEL